MEKNEAVRLLNQATFGATPKLVDSVIEEGFENWIEAQILIEPGKSHWDRMLEIDWDNTAWPDGMYGVMIGREHIVNETWRTFIESKTHLRARVAAALLEIFVISARVDVIGIKNNQRTAASFLDMLEKNAFGNYEKILRKVSRHPAMAHYLSFYDNRKAEYNAEGEELKVPDENYARELLQLFSIGLYELNQDGSLKQDASGNPIETYTQDDIFNLARVFTGWVYDTRETKIDRFRLPMQSDRKHHAPEKKTFLNAQIPANTPPKKSLKAAINAIFNHPNVGPFIGKQLIQRLVSSNPTPGYIGRVSAAFNDNGQGVRGDMRAVIKAILLDDEARHPEGFTPDQAKIQGKVREPIMRLTAIARLLDLKHTSWVYPIANLMDTSHGLGQSPFKSPSVFNFFRPGYTPPNSEVSNNNYLAPEFQIVTGSAIPGAINFVNEFISNRGAVFETRDKVLNSLAGDAGELIDYIDLMLTSSTLKSIDRSLIINLVNLIPVNDRNARVNAALQAVAASPAFLIQR